jgi:hypothetical protein
MLPDSNSSISDSQTPHAGGSESDVVCELRGLADSEEFRVFTAKLVPNVDADTVLGIRMPALRKYAKTFVRENGGARCREFLAQLPHHYHEENLLHGICLGLVAKTPLEAFELLDMFLPCVNNWVVSDTMRIPAFKKDMDATLAKIREWTSLDHGKADEYAVRFGIVTLMSYFLDDHFSPKHLELVACIDRGEYYINMARAWYFATAMAKQWDETIGLFEARPSRLDDWTHDKSIQKARESYRITPERKQYLLTLKV